MTHKFWAVTGRIPGDDEDVVLCVGQHPNSLSAMCEFKAEMRERFHLTAEDSVHLRESHDTDVFINTVLCSDTPIEEAP